MFLERSAVDEEGNRISCFAEPHHEKMSFSHFLDFLQHSRASSPPEVPYLQVLVINATCLVFFIGSSISESSNYFITPLQHQNNNLQMEFPELCNDIEVTGPQWATSAFGCIPEAVNLWIGDERSVTSFHKGKLYHFQLVLFLGKSR